MVQTEEEYQQLTEIEKGEAIVLIISQKIIRQLIKVLARIQQRDYRYIDEKEVGLVDREGMENNGSGMSATTASWTR